METTNYTQGEEIKAFVAPNQTIYIREGPWIVWRKSEGVVSYEPPANVQLCSKVESTCGIGLPMKPRSSECIEVSSNETLTWRWNQTKWVLEVVNCTSVETGEKILNWGCTKPVQAEPGNYTLIFSYATECPVKEKFGEGTEIKEMKKQFTILE